MAPKIVTKKQFEQATNKKDYKNFLKYMDREEAKNPNDKSINYDIYISYVFDIEKTDNMFNNETNHMDKGEVEKLGKDFNNSQKNGGIMWKDVISFDNSVLVQEGLYDEKTGLLDEQKFKTATRKMMETFEKKEGLSNNTSWGASIHYNTDNIHIHVATVEKNVSKDRGKVKQSTIDDMKSTFANDVFDISGERKAINEFIRDRVVKGIKEQDSPNYDKNLKKQFKKIHETIQDIPKNNWQYNNNVMKNIRPEIDKFTNMYIEKYQPKEFKEFNKKLEQQSEIYKSTYGDNSNYKQYIDTKMSDLYQRSGNTILKEIKEYDGKISFKKGDSENKKVSKPNTNIKQEFHNRMYTSAAIFNLKHNLRSDFDKDKNIKQYDYEFGIDNTNER